MLGASLHLKLIFQLLLVWSRVRILKLDNEISRENRQYNREGDLILNKRKHIKLYLNLGMLHLRRNEGKNILQVKVTVLRSMTFNLKVFRYNSR
jgi:hypothetical protein